MEGYYIAALKETHGIGDKVLQDLLARFSFAKAVWEADEGELKQAEVLKEDVLKNFIKFRASNPYFPEKLMESCKKCNAKTVAITDENFPFMLKELKNPPSMLYYKGTLPAKTDLCIAMVGSRNFTNYGKEAAEMIAEDLARYGVVVVSGAARGIDTAAHVGALKAGRTVAVLGCGIDYVYPPENRKLFYEIVEKGGAIISEYKPGTSPYPAFFPARNRIISGLSHGTVVVEAGRKSGALITADHAVNDNRDVFAVPGSIFSNMSAGPNWLLTEGAIPARCAEDILKEYRGNRRVKAYQNNDESDKPVVEIKKIEDTKPKEKTLPEMTEDEKLVYQLLSFHAPLSKEEIYISMPSHIDIQNLNMTLLNLIMKGIAKETDLHKYIRVERS
ncbi:MAG: DNA-processing protein DprA [Selenomonadaceae bacterium]|nr:DNA-processing protein DprA [Selenomonadaceae bacterium]